MNEPLNEPVLSETADVSGAYIRLTPADIDRLTPSGELRSVPAGEVIFEAGVEVPEFLVIRRGWVAILEHGQGHEQIVRVHGRGRFLGDLGMLEGQPALYTARALTDAELLAVPRDALMDAVARDPILGERILRAYLIRRSLLIEAGTGIRIVGSRFSPATRRLLEFAARNRIPHRLVDLDKDEHAEAFVRSLGVDVDETPLVIIGPHDILRSPSISEVAEKLGLRHEDELSSSCDVLVVGAGPAGLATAVYASSDGLRVSLVDAWAAGGQAATSALIENYLGFPAGISGSDLAERATLQARKFGTALSVAALATALRRSPGRLVVSFEDGAQIAASAVVVATGVRYLRLDVPGIERFESTSVFYAATIHEATACSADPVAVVGGGNSAGQAALFLASRVPRVTMIVRGECLDEFMSRYLVTQIEAHPAIEVLLHSEVRDAVGDDVLRQVIVVDVNDQRLTTVPARALFVFVGARPHTGWLNGAVALDENGYILTGSKAIAGTGPNGIGQTSTPLRALETSMPGVFAAGDVRSGSVKRMTSAVGEGAMAVGLIHDYLGLSPDARPDHREALASEPLSRRSHHAR